MVDVTQRQSSSFSKLTNENEDLTVDVIDEQLLKRLATTSYVSGGEIDSNPQGLKGEWRITTVLVTDVATLLPISQLADRNFIRIENTEPSKSVFVGPNNLVTPNLIIGTTSGKRLDPGESVNFDFKGNLVVYGICEAGKTAIVQITEAQ